MSQPDLSALRAFVETIPQLYKGPGGAVAVVKDGEVILRHSWGFADLERHKPVTAQTRMPICSVSKQFTCAILLDSVGAPEKLDGLLADYLDMFEDERPTVRDLCNNQSGLRDYWALTVLCGADPEGVFLPEHARSLLRRLKTTHFAPGTHYSYSNGNFRILADLIEQQTGRKLADLLSERIFRPAGMKTAELLPDTAAFHDCVGYEGDIDRGFIPAINRIHWEGDAGIVASLDDMIAWEQFIDATRDDEDGLYRRISTPQTYRDGNAAHYGFGLKHDETGGYHLTGHGGALRGWRCHRWHAADARISTIALLNFEGAAAEIATRLMDIALGITKPEPQRVAADPDWFGAWLSPETGLVLTLEDAGHGRMKVGFGVRPEIVNVVAPDQAQSGHMVLKRAGERIELVGTQENLKTTLHRIGGKARLDVVGRYHSDELDADLTLVDQGGALYGCFEGFLGRSTMYPLYPLGEDVWYLPVQRSMDAPSPGDWKLVFQRDAQGAVSAVQVGCWLARNVQYVRA